MLLFDQPERKAADIMGQMWSDSPAGWPGETEQRKQQSDAMCMGWAGLSDTHFTTCVCASAHAEIGGIKDDEKLH